LREEADRGGDLGLGVVRREPRGRRELVLCWDRSPETLQRGAVEQLPPDASLAGAQLQHGELTRRGEARNRGRHGETWHERRPSRGKARVKEALGLHGGLHVWIARQRLPPRRLGRSSLAGGNLREAEMEQDERARRVPVGEPLEPRYGSGRPRCERG